MRSPEISHEITAQFQWPDFSMGLLCLRQFVVCWKRKVLATKYVKYFEKNSLPDCKSHSPNLEPDTYI